MIDHTALGPCEEVARLLATFDQAIRLDVASAIEMSGGDAECVSPDYPPDDADQAVELSDPALIAEVNATLAFLAEHGPGVAIAFATLGRLEGRLNEVVEDTFGFDVDPAVYDGLRVARRIEAARALGRQVVGADPDLHGPVPLFPQ